MASEEEETWQCEGPGGCRTVSDGEKFHAAGGLGTTREVSSDGKCLFCKR